jgi:hypothetical protein
MLCDSRLGSRSNVFAAYDDQEGRQDALLLASGTVGPPGREVARKSLDAFLQFDGKRA